MKLYYEDSQGQGPALLMVAGLASDAVSWLFQVPLLREYFRVIVCDNRGVGRSPKPPGPYAVSEMARDILEILDELGLQRLHMVGHSLGGAICQQLALDHPERVSKLILACTSAHFSGRSLAVVESWAGCVRLGVDPAVLGRVLFPWLYTVATTLAIVRAGGVPVFIDVDTNGNVDLDLAERAFEADPTLRYFVPVHLYGNPLNMDRLGELKVRFGLSIVEDCAQAIGARWRDRPVGTVGDLSTLSLYPTKNLGAMGDGGAIIGSEPKLISRCRQLRDYGQGSKYRHEALGLNSRLDELQAAILRDAFFPRLEAWTARRRAIASQYRQAFPELALLLSDAAYSVAHLFPITLTNQDTLKARLNTRDIQTAVHYPVLIPDQPALADCRFSLIGSVEQARRLAQNQLSLPMHPYLSDTEVHHVIKSLQEFLS